MGDQEWITVDDASTDVAYWPTSAWRSFRGQSTDYIDQSYHTVVPSGFPEDALPFIFFQFRGVGFSIMAGSGGSGTCFATLSTDLNPVGFPCNPGDTNGEVFQRTPLRERDFELRIEVSRDSVFNFDAIRVQVADGASYQPQAIGPTARDVPEHAIVIDNFNPSVSYSPDGWDLENDVSPDRYSGTVASMRPLNDDGGLASGQWFAIEFRGTAIWWYGDSYGAVLNFQLDSNPGELHTLDGVNDMSQELVWSVTGLEETDHTLNISHTGTGGVVLVDFFRVLPSENPLNPTTTGDGSPTATNTNTGSSPSGKGFPVGAIAGIVVGVVLLAAIVLAVVLWRKYKRRKPTEKPSADADMTISPFTPPDLVTSPAPYLSSKTTSPQQSNPITSSTYQSHPSYQSKTPYLHETSPTSGVSGPKSHLRNQPPSSSNQSRSFVQETAQDEDLPAPPNAIPVHIAPPLPPPTHPTLARYTPPAYAPSPAETEIVEVGRMSPVER